MRELSANQDSAWKRQHVPRGKCHNKTETKTTVSLYLDRNLVERARNRSLNLSRITEQALSSIIDYLETQNKDTSPLFSVKPLSEKRVIASPPGIEPGTPGFLRTFRLKARCSVLTELRALYGPCLSFL